MLFEEIIKDFSTIGLQIDKIKIYLESGQNPNQKNPRCGRSLLHFAVEGLYEELVRLLYKYGADLNDVDFQGYSPLHCAVNSSIDSALQAEEEVSMAIVKLLIDLGSDEFIRASKGNQPRDIAASYGQAMLDIYDNISNYDWTTEPNIEKFTCQLIEILQSEGFSTKVNSPGYISVALDEMGHKQVWKHSFLWAGGYYHLRNSQELATKILSIYKKTNYQT